MQFFISNQIHVKKSLQFSLKVVCFSLHRKEKTFNTYTIFVFLFVALVSIFFPHDNGLHSNGKYER